MTDTRETYNQGPDGRWRTAYGEPPEGLERVNPPDILDLEELKRLGPEIAKVSKDCDCWQCRSARALPALIAEVERLRAILDGLDGEAMGRHD